MSYNWQIPPTKKKKKAKKRQKYFAGFVVKKQ